MDLGKDAFTLCYDPGALREAPIRRAIEALGFHPRPARPGELEGRSVPDPGAVVPEPVAATLQRGRESGLLVLVEFHADWCAPCKIVERKVLPDPRVRHALAGFEVIRVDTDRFPAAGRFYAVDAMPTLLVLDGDGKELRRFVGLQEPAELADSLRKLTGGPGAGTGEHR